MKIGARRRLNIINMTMRLATWIIFIGLVIWGVALYGRYEWMMW